MPPERRKRGAGSQTSTVSTGAESPAAAEPKSRQVGESAEQAVAKSAAETMREKLHATAGQAVYKMRKAVVEPVFGQIKERRGLWGFLMRGREKATGMADHLPHPQPAEVGPGSKCARKPCNEHKEPLQTQVDWLTCCRIADSFRRFVVCTVKLGCGAASNPMQQLSA